MKYPLKMFQELFVDAPADGSSDDDTTDSEESVYSGLEEEEEESGSEEEVVEDDDSDDEEEDEDEEAASSESESETENGETSTVMTTDSNIHVLRSRKNGLAFCRKLFQMHFPQWKCLNLSKISLKFVLKGAIDNKPA